MLSPEVELRSVQQQSLKVQEIAVASANRNPEERHETADRDGEQRDNDRNIDVAKFCGE